MTEIFERNLAVRVRLAEGTLILNLAPRTRSLTAEEAWLWHRLDGSATTEDLCRESGSDADEIRAALQTLAEDGFVRPITPGQPG